MKTFTPGGLVPRLLLPICRTLGRASARADRRQENAIFGGDS